jgi:hypothetical protein
MLEIQLLVARALLFSPISFLSILIEFKKLLLLAVGWLAWS